MLVMRPNNRAYFSGLFSKDGAWRVGCRARCVAALRQGDRTRAAPRLRMSPLPPCRRPGATEIDRLLRDKGLQYQVGWDSAGQDRAGAGRLRLRMRRALSPG